MTHICVSKLTIIGSDNGFSPGRRQAIIWTNAGILSIGLLGTKFSEILIEIRTFSFKKMRLKVSSAKWPPFCLGLNVLMCLPSWPKSSYHKFALTFKWFIIHYGMIFTSLSTIHHSWCKVCHFNYGMYISVRFLAIYECFNALPPRRHMANLMIDILSDFVYNCPQVYATRSHKWKVNTGSSNGFVPSGSMPLIEPMFTTFSYYDIINNVFLLWYHICTRYCLCVLLFCWLNTNKQDAEN